MVTKKLKIVVVYFDNHPGAVMGCVGNSEVHTPNLAFEIDCLKKTARIAKKRF
jgi:hypothetical protein